MTEQQRYNVYDRMMKLHYDGLTGAETLQIIGRTDIKSASSLFKIPGRLTRLVGCRYEVTKIVPENEDPFLMRPWYGEFEKRWLNMQRLIGVNTGRH